MIEGEASGVRTAFRQALDLPEAKRVKFLSTLPDQLREEVEELLRLDRGADTALGGIVRRGQIPLGGVGERFGAYRAVELVGRGGMGAVYRAERADGEVAQTVAIKVMERAWLNPGAIERFRQERQILAGLTHPNIAHLIDGGTREDGVPYLVMEYVAGAPIDRYCEERGLTQDERLRLMITLCEAVDSAHQKLIIHRDLKPSNILVTETGGPKLLDFGIAKTLDDAAGMETQTIVLTPAFASPEQRRGERATMAADVYGLGAVLHVLLAGRPVDATGPALEGDLRNIVRKATDEEPDQRYRSARELAEDLERYLEHRPVRATPASAAYRMKRFVRRHAWACAAGALALAAIVSGAAMSLYQAHRAEQRFADVRTLANRFVFDFEAAIRDTPGTLAARKMVASTAREYLARLSADAGRDPGLQRELAESYYRLSRVEINAGESTAALDHLRRAVAMEKDLRADCCGTPQDRARYLRRVGDLAKYLFDTRGRVEAMQVMAAALKNARDWRKAEPRELLAQVSLEAALSAQGGMLFSAGKLAESRQALEEAVTAGQSLMTLDPGNEEYAYERANAGYRLATALGGLNDYPAALAQEKQSMAVLDRLLARHPDNNRWRNQRIYMLDYVGDFLRHLAEQAGKPDPSIVETYRQASAQGEESVRRNPGDKDALAVAQFATTRLANQLVREKRFEEAEPVARQSLELSRQLVREDPSNRRNRYLFANAVHLESNLLTNAKRFAEAEPALVKARAEVEAALRQWPDDLEFLRLFVSILSDQAEVKFRLGHVDAAREDCRLAMTMTSQIMARTKDYVQPIGDLPALRERAKMLGLADLTAQVH